MKLATFALSFFIYFQSQATERVEFVANRIHSLLVFVNNIAGDPFGSPAIKELFEKSSFNTNESKQKIKQLEVLDSAFERYITFSGVPKERKSGLSVEKMIWMHSAFATSLDDLSQRTVGIIRYDEQSQFFEVLRYFEPIHDQLLWNSNSKELSQTAALFQKKSVQWKLDELFKKVVKFYDSKWPDAQKFRVSLFPIPKGSNYSMASSYGAFESVGVIMGEKDIEGRFGVIFHELCHSLYDAQSSEFQNQISKWYQESQSPYSRMTYSWMNETLATILGNAWAYSKVTGKIEKTSWYHQPTIDGFAKALYPEVLKYLDANQSIDQKFVETSIQVFQKTFPDSIKELGSLLTNLSFFTDGSFGSSRALAKDLRGIYRIQSMGSSSPINNEESLRALRDNRTSTVFFLARRNNIKQFDYLKAEFPFLTKFVKQAQSGKSLLGLFDQDGKKYLIAILKDDVGFDFVLQKLKTLKKIEKLNEFLDLDTI